MQCEGRRLFLKSAGAALVSMSFPGQGRSGGQAPPAGKRDFHKVAISVDMEGISGVVSEQEVTFGTEEFHRARKWLVADVNAAIEGALDGGATYIEVHDTHGANKRHIPYDELHPAAHLVKGGNLFFWEYDALDASFGAAFMIGMHAGPLAPGILSHYFTSQIRAIRFNAQPVTESHMTAALAAYFGIPTVLVTGDDQVCSVMREWSKGQMETVVTKRALARNSGIVAPLARTRQQIRAAAQRALRQAPQVTPLGFQKPLEVTVDLATAEEAKSVALMPGVERSGDTAVTFTATNALEAHKTLIAALLILTSAVNLARP